MAKNRVCMPCKIVTITFMKRYIRGVILVLVVNLCLNLWVLRFNDKVPFSDLYWGDHHYFTDQRIEGGKFNLLEGWAQTDSQWYIKIAEKGYGEPKNLDIWSRQMDGLSYAFFPLYPIFIRFFAMLTGWHYLLGAFILSNLILVLSWLSIDYVIAKVYSKKYAFLTATLITLFPFSLFLRSYHAEGLYLLELTWWLYFLTKKQFGKASLLMGLLNVTKGTGWLLNVILFFGLLGSYKAKKVNKKTIIFYMALALIPIVIWLAFVYLATGDVFYFYKAVSMWKILGVPPFAFNIVKISHVIVEALNGNWINVSQVVVFFAMCVLTYTSRKWLKSEWWWTSFLLFIVPTLTTYSSGHTSGRLAVVQLPLWVYLVSSLGKKWGIVLAVIFTIFLYTGSLYFVNWYWWG